jgi:hypothetical protein
VKFCLSFLTISATSDCTKTRDYLPVPIHHWSNNCLRSLEDWTVSSLIRSCHPQVSRYIVPFTWWYPVAHISRNRQVAQQPPSHVVAELLCANGGWWLQWLNSWDIFWFSWLISHWSTSRAGPGSISSTLTAAQRRVHELEQQLAQHVRLPLVWSVGILTVVHTIRQDFLLVAEFHWFSMLCR